MNTLEELARLLEEDEEMCTLCFKHNISARTMCKAAACLRKTLKIETALREAHNDAVQYSEKRNRKS